MAASSSQSFKLRARQLFFTWPQCEATKEEVLMNIQTLFGDNLQWSCVSAEKHQDGTPHLHAVVKLKSPKQFSGQSGLTLLDNLAGKHGNYQYARMIWNTLKYVTKDGDFCSHGIEPSTALSQHGAKKSTASSLVAEKLMEPTNEPMAKRLRTIRNENPGFYLLHRQKIQEFAAELVMEKRMGEKPSGVYRAEPEEENAWNQELAIWLNQNILKKDPRPHKQPQLWLYGGTNLGKTTLVSQLENLGIRIYRMPYDGNWYDSYENGAYDLIVFDEYGGSNCYPVHKLNQWLEGAPLPVCRRGKAPLIKEENLPMIVLSNHSPSVVYSKYAGEDLHRLDPLRARLLIVEARGNIRIMQEVDDSTSDDEVVESEEDIDDDE